MTTPIRELPPHVVDRIRIPIDRIRIVDTSDISITPRIPDAPGVLNLMKTPGDLAQEELKRRNEEFNRRFMEELERQRWFDKVAARFSDNYVATPPPGVRQLRGSEVQQPRQNLEEDLENVLKRLEEQRRREAELFERLDQLKSIWADWRRVPRLVELPEMPWAIPPWRWALPIRPIPMPLPVPNPTRPATERRKEAIPA